MNVKCGALWIVQSRLKSCLGSLCCPWARHFTVNVQCKMVNKCALFVLLSQVGSLFFFVLFFDVTGAV